MNESELTGRVIGAAIEVHKVLGPGLLESIYQRSLAIEFELRGIDSHSPVHTAQILSYMKLANVPLGLLINFNVPVLKNGIKRLALGNPSP